MRQYKCTNCEYNWTAQEEPFECPKCHSASVVEVKGKPSLSENVRHYWWILACAAVAALLIVFFMPKNTTRVVVDTGKSKGRMEVKLKGKHANEYLVMMRQNDVVEKKAFTKDDNPVIFMDLRGDYVLEVRYMGEGTAPKIKKFKNKYSFDERKDDSTIETKTASTTPRPEIVELKPTPKRIAEGGSYTVTVILSSRGCSEEDAQFSMDGEAWQDSPKFSKLKPGEYTFMARNKAMKDLVSERNYVLEEAYKKECLTVEKANGLMTRIANGDKRSIKEFKKYASDKTTVKGCEEIKSVYYLLLDAEEEEAVNYTITDIDCNKGCVESITIKAK